MLTPDPPVLRAKKYVKILFTEQNVSRMQDFLIPDVNGGMLNEFLCVYLLRMYLLIGSTNFKLVYWNVDLSRLLSALLKYSGPKSRCA